MSDKNNRTWSKLTLLLLAVLFEATSIACSNYTNEDEDYGKTWMYIPDGDGIPQVAYLTEEDGRSRTSYKKNAKETMRFELYRREERQPKTMKVNGDRKRRRRNLEEFTKAFDTAAPTYVIIHGWKSSSDSDTVQNIKDNYLQMEDANVIAVDWREVASNNFYFVPARQTREVGQYTAEMIDFMCKEKGADINKFHLIGHSLGAHTVGYAGMYVTAGRIQRITGLDPAKPGFEDTSTKDDSLDPSDAEFVDVIHTCGGTLGYAKPLGHIRFMGCLVLGKIFLAPLYALSISSPSVKLVAVFQCAIGFFFIDYSDFYPNGGRAHQPGCRGIYKEFMEACSHGRSHHYFAESILRQGNFTGYPCHTYETYEAGACKRENGVLMGDPTPRSARGTYFLKTSDASPYAQGRRKRFI